MVGGMAAGASKWPIAVGSSDGLRSVPELFASEGPRPRAEVGVEEERGAYFSRISAFALPSGHAVVEEGPAQVAGEAELGAGVEEVQRLPVMSWTLLVSAVPTKASKWPTSEVTPKPG